MAPQVRALAQSESKARFMARLGLDERRDEHKQLYTMMKVGFPSIFPPLSATANATGVERHKHSVVFSFLFAGSNH